MTEKPIPQPPDPTLDVTSAQFDPLKALYASADLLKPIKNARLYDNVAKYERSIQLQESASSSNSTVESASTKTAPNPAEPGASTSTRTINKILSKPTDDGEQFQRKFQAHQLMIPGTGPKARHKRNLLDRLADEQRFQGPLATLQKQMVTGQRIKVFMRNASGICGHMTGNLEMFDKHWNVALRDVDEVWKRRKAFQCDTADYDAASDDRSAPTTDCDRRMRDLRLRFAAVTVRSLNRKYVECSRRLPRAMIRGEQVALIVLIAEPSTEGMRTEQTLADKSQQDPC